MAQAEQKELTRADVRVKAPKAYCCVIHNDDVTTMDFVVMAISSVFNKTSYDAARLMMRIHNHGRAKIGSYSYDIAVTKKQAMDALAASRGFPLKTTVEEADA